MSAPGPLPTSRTRCPPDDAGEVGQLRGERARVAPHEAVVGGSGDLETHPDESTPGGERDTTPAPAASRGDRDLRTAGYGVVADRVNVIRLL